MGDIMIPEPAKSLRKYEPLFEKKGKKVVLDFGSGNLRNSIFLHRKGYEVYAVDLPHKVKIKSLPRLTCILPEEILYLPCEINLTLCTFVLNLISQEERNRFLNLIAQKMSNDGFLLVETKGFSLSGLDCLIIPKGFTRVHYEQGRYTIIVLYQYTGKLC